MRVYRQWRNLKLRKWFGFGYKADPPGPGDLAIFCVACPQEGFNLAPGWEEDPDQ